MKNIIRKHANLFIFKKSAELMPLEALTFLIDIWLTRNRQPETRLGGSAFKD